MKRKNKIIRTLTLGIAATTCVLSLASCGSKGDKGDKGDAGKDGVSVSSIAKTSTEGNVDTYTITYSDGTKTTFVVTNGVNGSTGAAGKDGSVVTIGENGNWYIDGVDTLISAKGEKGDKGDAGTTGISVVSILKTKTEGLVDTYTITYSDGNSTTFTVTNGAIGQAGAAGKDGSVVTIGENGNWYIDGVDTLISAKGDKGDKGDAGKDGVSVSSITKTSTVGNVDTYTITYSNGTTTTFTVTNGEIGQTGAAGKDGSVVTIGEDGYWYIDSTKTDVKAVGADGDEGKQGEKGETAWSNTILPATNGYIICDVGSAIKGEDITFTFVPFSGYYLYSTTFDGINYETYSGANTNEKISIKKQMQDGGFVVGAEFKKVVNTTVDTTKNTEVSENNITTTIKSSDTLTKNVDITSSNSVVTIDANMNADVSSTQTLSVTGENTNVIITKGTSIENYDLTLSSNSTLTIEEGASVSFKSVTLEDGATINLSNTEATFDTLTVSNGATVVGDINITSTSQDGAVNLSDGATIDGNVVVEKGNVLIDETSTIKGDVTITSGTIKGSNKTASTASVVSETNDTYDIEGLITINGQTTLDGLKIKGRIEVLNKTGKFSMKNCYYVANGNATSNAYLPINTSDIEIVDNQFILNSVTYNFIETNYSTQICNSVTITRNIFDCKGMTHNVINLYRFADDASIDLTQNAYYNIDFNTTQPVRLSNVNKAKNVTIDISKSIVEDYTISGYEAFDTFILFQDDTEDFSQNMETFVIIADEVEYCEFNYNKQLYDKGAYYEGLLGIYNKKQSSVSSDVVTPVFGVASENSLRSLVTKDDIKVLVLNDIDLSNVNDGKVVPIEVSGKNVIVDLGEKTITSKYRTFSVVDGGVVTIKNGNLKASDCAISVNNSTVTLEDNLNVVAQEFCVIATNESKVVVNGGTYTSADNAVLGTNGTKGIGGNTITINGGTFNGNITTTGYIACGVYVANDDTLVVNAATFNITNGVGILARSGNTTVSDNVEFNITQEANGITAGYVGDSKIIVPTNKNVVKDLVANYPGGTPSVEYSNYYTLEYKEVSTQDELQKACANTEDTVNYIKLVDNITLTSRIDVSSSNTTIDLNGKTVTISNTLAVGSKNQAQAFNVLGSVSCTIKNGTIDGTLKTQIEGEGDKNECDPIVARSGADVVLENMNIKIDSITGACVFACIGGKITILSGTYTNINTIVYQYNTNMTSLTVNQQNNADGTQAVFVKGGTFVGENPANGDDSGNPKTFLAAGYVSTESSTNTYVVSKSN